MASSVVDLVVPSHGSVALPVLFSSLDAQRLQDAFNSSSTTAFSPPSYSASSVFVSEPGTVSSSSPITAIKRNQPVLSSVPLIGSPSSISSRSLSTSSSSSSSTSDESLCFSDDGTSVDAFDAIDFLESFLLPSSDLLSSSHHHPVASFCDETWHGAVVNDTLLVSIAGGQLIREDLRERVVALLEKADEELECSSVVISLSKNDPYLSDLIHSLLYVGGTVIAPDHPRFAHSEEHVLVGLEL